ncbi:MAG: hypothetical protein V3V89_03380, partial [Gammaproteobacteria bacterium]
TQLQLDEIKEVLLGFTISQGRLPCPDNDNDGAEDRTAGECDTEMGNLPWSTLGVMSVDTWSNSFTYRVAEDFADDTVGTGCGTATLGVSISLCSDGNITILDSDGGANIATLVPALVVSHGKNWAVSTSADEAENTDGDDDFVDKDYSQTGGSEFDDMLIWISPHMLRNRMLMSGFLP